VLVVSAKGYGKRTAVEEYRITNRGGKGVKTINVTEKTGQLIGLLNVNETQDLMITCKSGVTIRTSIASIREAGRATQGVKLIKLDEGDEIAAITNLNDTEIEEESGETQITAEESVENDTIIPTGSDEGEEENGEENTDDKNSNETNNDLDNQ
jgi:DNA gyrase subunit A